MKIIAPEKNRNFSGLAEAAKKLRVVEYSRTSLSNMAEERKGRPAVFDPELLKILLPPIEGVEREIEKELAAAYHREVPRAIQEWAQDTQGLGVKSLARLLGVLGHPAHATPYVLKEGSLLAQPEFHRSLRQWWAYSGNGDIQRQPGRNFVGEKPTQEDIFAGGRAEGRKRAHVCAIDCIRHTGKPGPKGRCTKRSPYRDVYDDAKAIAVSRGWGEQTRREPYGANRSDMHAFRLTRKAILRDLYLVSRGTCC